SAGTFTGPAPRRPPRNTPRCFPRSISSPSMKSSVVGRRRRRRISTRAVSSTKSIKQNEHERAHRYGELRSAEFIPLFGPRVCLAYSPCLSLSPRGTSGGKVREGSGRGESEPDLAMCLLSPALSSRRGGEGEETTAKPLTADANGPMGKSRK